MATFIIRMRMAKPATDIGLTMKKIPASAGIFLPAVLRSKGQKSGQETKNQDYLLVNQFINALLCILRYHFAIYSLRVL